MKAVYSLLCLLAAAASTVYMALYLDRKIAMIQAVVFLALCLMWLIIYAFKTATLKKNVARASKYLENKEGAETRPFPTLVCDGKGDIIWYNELFGKSVLGEELIHSGNIKEFIGDISIETLKLSTEGSSIAFGDKKYTVYLDTIPDGKPIYCLYFIDYTELKNIADEYKQSRPVVIQFKLDNLDEIYQNFKSSECEVISGEIEKILEQWASKYTGLFRKVGSGKFLMVTQERALDELKASKFDILKQVRDYKYGNREVDVTISIGVGHGGNYDECDEFSVQALEMSQSRGGDQATINCNGELQFYGGTQQGTTKQAKIKARIIASAFADHVANSDAVFVMGHAFSDLDSVGSAVGIYMAVRALGGHCYILCDKEKSMAKQLIEQLDSTDVPNTFIDANTAGEYISARSLLVVVDTHRAASLEYPELYPEFENVVVIDHHRRTANYISNAVLYYDEPNASSACEMVTELLQYVPAKVELPALCAEALLSGIMLDTRNFILSTGARTFEAAAYLKNSGANTVSAKQLFANDFDSYKQKYAIISTAVTYKGCAVAVATDHADNMRLVASQAANELLNVAGVKSSYVLFEENNQINISARSLGEMNVQVIMERLGGGGHLTMAATQIENITMGDAVVKLEDAINEYFEENDI